MLEVQGLSQVVSEAAAVPGDPLNVERRRVRGVIARVVLGTAHTERGRGSGPAGTRTAPHADQGRPARPEKTNFQVSFYSLKLVLGIARDKVVIRFREWFGEQCVERTRYLLVATTRSRAQAMHQMKVRSAVRMFQRVRNSEIYETAFNLRDEVITSGTFFASALALTAIRRLAALALRCAQPNARGRRTL